MSVKFTSRLNELARRLPVALRERNAHVAEEIAEHARELAPVRTGALRDSITAESETETGAGVVHVGVEYAGYVEWGSARQAAQPYLTPAVEAVKAKLPEHYKKLIE